MLELLVHYGEISLKGKNQYEFERQLIRNIKASAKTNNLNLDKVKRSRKRIELIFIEEDKNLIIELLSNIPGIKNFSFVESIKRDEEELFVKVREYLTQYKESGILELSLQTKRSDKQFSLKSPEINSKIGEIALELGIKINYKSTYNIFHTHVTQQKIFLSSKKYQGIGGLPVGSVGRVLCLLSGGIDSPVAAYHLMKRGCRVDFVHFHSFATNEIAYKSKINDTIKVLNKFQGKSQLYLIPNVVYEMLTGGKIYSNYEMIFFKNFILNYTSKLSQEYGYQGIVTGDNLAQVASQTIENMHVTSLGVDSLILRPLLSYEKDDIVDESRIIGTYDLSIKEYKDCCSLLAKNPVTKAKVEKFNKVKSNIDFDEIYLEAKKKMDNFLIE